MHRYLFVQPLLLLLFGCHSFINSDVSRTPNTCVAISTSATAFTSVDVVYTASMHGNSARLISCPTKAVTLNFSHINFATKSEQDLADKIMSVGFFPGKTINLSIDGILIPASKNDLLDKVLVSRVRIIR